MSAEMQNEAEIFRGTTRGETRFKDHRSVRGTPKAGMPAFVLGEELAALANTDPRIVVSSGDGSNPQSGQNVKVIIQTSTGRVLRIDCDECEEGAPVEQVYWRQEL